MATCSVKAVPAMVTALVVVCFNAQSQAEGTRSSWLRGTGLVEKFPFVSVIKLKQAGSEGINIRI